MKINKNYEIELNLKDFLFHILYKWWFLLLMGVIVAGYFGFMEYWSFERYHRAGELAPAEVQYEANVEANQKALEQAEKALAEFEALARDNNGGREVSILMGMDPTNIWTAEKKYYLDAGGASEIAKKVLLTLSEAFSVEIDGDELSRVFGTDLRRDIDRVAFVYADTDLNTLSVFGCGGTKEEANKRKEFADSYLQAVRERLAKESDFSLEVISDGIGTKSMLVVKNIDGTLEEKDLASIQNALRSNYQNYQNQVASYTQNRDNLRAKTFEKPVPKILSRGIVGFLIGIGIGAVLCILAYFFNGRLKNGREMRNRYDVGLLGDFSHSRGIWKGKGLDWLLEKVEFGKKTDFENELDSIAFLMDEAKDGKTILLTGTLEEKRLRKVYDGLAIRMKEQGIELVFEPDFLRNSEAVAASRDLDSVLLVEEKYVSRVRDLNRMAEMLEIEEANVIGAVLL